MTSLVLQIIAGIIAAVVLSGLAVRRLLDRPIGTISKECWYSQVDLTEQAFGSLYGRAYIARHGGFALSATETVYFLTQTDSAGQKLQCNETYCIQGQDPDARWWSLTAYKDERLIDNPSDRYSFSKTTVARTPDGGWKIYMSPRPKPENWLPSGSDAGNLTLLFRMYSPSRQMLDDLSSVRLPHIVKVTTA